VYYKYFNLVKEPFAVTSDPEFLWLGAEHEEAFAHLYYAIERRRGFAVLTGEIGTGKTTLVHALLDKLGEQVLSALVLNATLNTEELLHYIMHDFGIPSPYDSHAAAVIALNDWLVARAEDGRNAIIIIDEAQNLSLDTLENLRLFSNLEHGSNKLVQIILVGQPELKLKLASPNLVQLSQRIAIRFHLSALKSKDMRPYVEHRLSVAGAPAPATLFTNSALEKLHAASQGVPRVINQLCDTALLKAFGRKLPHVDDDLVDDMLRDEFAQNEVMKSEVGSAAIVGAPFSRASAVTWTGRFQFVATSIAVFCLLIAAWWIGRAHLGERSVGASKVVGVSAREALSVMPNDAQDSTALHEMRAELVKMRAELARRDSLQRIDPVAIASRTDLNRKKLDRASDRSSSGVVEVVVKPNDTLVRLAQKHLGRDDWETVLAILELNPSLQSPNFIRVGEVLKLPVNLGDHSDVRVP
jgi:type II secretory pathway predicted ATPase ExeA